MQAPAPGRVVCNMTFSMHKNTRCKTHEYLVTGMTDEKDIMVLLQHIIWNLCGLTDELKFACKENNFFVEVRQMAVT